MADALPTIGAAIPIAMLATFRPWLLEKDRDLELQDFYTADVLEADWRPQVEAARRALDGWSGRLGIHGPFRSLCLYSSDPEIRAVVNKRIHQALDVCAALGATQMVIHSPFTHWDFRHLDLLADARDRMIEGVHRTLHDVVERAASEGVVLVMENIEDIDPTDRLRLVDTFQSDAIQLSIDTGHAYYAHVTCGAPPVDYFVRAAGDRLKHVHLQDADGFADRHWAIGEGTITWPTVFRAFAELDEMPKLVFELRDHAGIPASIDYLVAAGLAQ